MFVLGIDPGFATLGLAIVDVAAAVTVARTWVFRTEKSPRKHAVRASDDNVRRAREIAEELRATIRTYRPAAIATEGQSWPRNAGASAKVGIAWGVLAAVADAHQLPMVQASPQQIKRVLCGVKTATKEQVIAAVEARFGEVGWPPQASLREHAADAIGAVVACLDSSVLQMARRMSA